MYLVQRDQFVVRLVGCDSSKADVGMVQRSGRARLAQKAFVRSLARRTGAEEAFGQDFDGDIALKASVAGRGRRHPCRTAKLFERLVGPDYLRMRSTLVHL
jgi:hypothetical protein